MKIIVGPDADKSPMNWRGIQADHQERLARLSIALAAAYEGDVGFAKTKGEAAYLRRRARTYRSTAKNHWGKAEHLRQASDA